MRFARAACSRTGRAALGMVADGGGHRLERDRGPCRDRWRSGRGFDCAGRVRARLGGRSIERPGYRHGAFPGLSRIARPTNAPSGAADRAQLLRNRRVRRVGLRRRIVGSARSHSPARSGSRSRHSRWWSCPAWRLQSAGSHDGWPRLRSEQMRPRRCFARTFQLLSCSDWQPTPFSDGGGWTRSLECRRATFQLATFQSADPTTWGHPV